MAITPIYINNLTTGDLSLDIRIDDRRIIRRKLTRVGSTNASANVADVATLDELNRNPELLSLRTGSSPKVSITVPTQGADDIPGSTVLASTGLKNPCRVATTANITLSGEQTIDGVAVVAGDRVLCKDQTSQPTRGIYVCSASTWTRAYDFDASSEVVAGVRVSIAEGTVNADTMWVLTTNNPIVLGTTNLAFSQGVNADLTAVAPADVTKAAAAVGVAGTAARSDHKHDISTAAPATGIGAANSEGSATSLARSDHDHVLRESGGQALTLGAMADVSLVQRSTTTLAASLPASGVPIQRSTIGADSTLAADVIGATTETIHTAISLLSASIATARRFIKFRARLHVIAANGADTWTFRMRLGGLAGVLLHASAAINITANDVYEFDGTIEIRTLGAPGTFDSVTNFRDPVGGAAGGDTAVLAGAVTTTGAVDLVVTGECSTNNAGNQVSLRHFVAEVMAA